MSQGRIKLDNPVFAGTLRYTHRSVSYTPKPVHRKTMQDIAGVRRTAPTVPVKAVVSQAKQYTHPPVRVQNAVSVQRAPQVESGRDEQATIAPVAGPRAKKRVLRTKALPLYVAALLIFGFGLYVGITGIVANKKVTAQAESLAKSGNETQAMSGNTAPPSTDKPSEAAVRNYAVAPGSPRYIDVPSLKIHARVLAMTVDKHNQLQAPYGIYDAGWYTSSAQPGQPGAMLIDGHSGVGNVHGIFHDIAKFVPGDAIVVTRGDGQKFTYSVVKTAVVDAESVDMGSLLVSADTSKPGLNLITCAGDQIPGTFSLKQRVVIYAVLQ